VKAGARRSGEPVKRFSVSLDLGDYERLVGIAEGHRPRLTLQYVVEYAILSFLEGAEDPQLDLRLQPLARRRGA
jgi:hypothetical protein